MKPAAVALASLLLISAVGSAGEGSAYTVTYISAEHVYLDGGRADGLSLGSRLAGPAAERHVAVLEVVYAAQHSASCRRLDTTFTVNVGDTLMLLREQPRNDTTAAPSAAKDVADRPTLAFSTERSASAPSPRAPVRLSGRAAIVYNSWFDKSVANLDFTQTSARLSLRVQNIWREHMTLTVRSRGRYDVRSRDYAVGAAADQWVNRLWTLSLEYDNPEAVLGITVGRFLPQRIGNVGYLDGGMMRVKLSGKLQSGFIVGHRPQWAYAPNNLSLIKYGAYLSYRSVIGSSWYLNQAGGIVGEYHNGIVSRTFAALSGSVRQGGFWGVSHSIEVEINNGWRGDKTDKAVALSNLYASTWLRLAKRIRLSLQYDNRRNYWTYEYRSRADSLFDDRVRHGVRSRIDLVPLPGFWLGGSIGYRSVEGETNPTRSYTASIRRVGLGSIPVNLSLSFSGFEGSLEHGTNYTVRTEIPVKKTNSVYIAVGGYRYSLIHGDDSRSSRRVEMGVNLDIGSDYYLGGGTEWNSGDDIHGLRLQLELGYRY